ncbi:hypothetical protein BN1708_005426 [Verticillium longisporum]|uniref:FAD-binding PCMH-type domain-containing protein n=1 Tax=Verticillium longisporum TaxID=100787 RepID=A0A0G4MAX2_VERLO|nr:hypothetical protein BN1708_005426 [Verticillium longisporum]
MHRAAFCMSASFGARPLLRGAGMSGPLLAGRATTLSCQRTLTTTPARRAEQHQGSEHSSEHQGWTTRSVLALAAATGTIGWALASTRQEGSWGTSLLTSGRGPTLLDGKPGRQPQYANMSQMERALKEIENSLGQEDIISTDPEDLHAHGYSEWSSTNPEGLPVAVAYPRSTEQVSAIARICNKYRIPIIPYSGGSSLEGNFSAPFGGISVDFAYMDKIIKFNKEDMDIVVQPSIGWQDLNEQLAKQSSGLFFPIDPGPSAKIGGMIGTNCSGTNAVKYGTMKDWVINLTVVLADGTPLKSGEAKVTGSAHGERNIPSGYPGVEQTPWGTRFLDQPQVMPRGVLHDSEILWIPVTLPALNLTFGAKDRDKNSNTPPWPLETSEI